MNRSIIHEIPDIPVSQFCHRLIYAATERAACLGTDVSTEILFDILLQEAPAAFRWFVVPDSALPVPDCVDKARVKGARPKFTAEATQVLSRYGSFMGQIQQITPVPSEIDEVHIAAALLLTGDKALLGKVRLRVSGNNAEELQEFIKSAVSDYNAHLNQEAPRRERSKLLKSLYQLRKFFKLVCFGQDEAIDRIINRLAIFITSPAEMRDNRPLSICLAGASGTGKTLIADTLRELIRSELGINSASTLEMSRFAMQALSDELIGRNDTWKDGGKIGELTGRAVNYPKGVIILENIDKAHPNAISYVETALSGKHLLDNYTDKMVSFADNIIILTTSVSFRDHAHFVKINEEQAGNIPNDKMVELVCEALAAERPANQKMADNNMVVRNLLEKTQLLVPMNDHGIESIRGIISQSVSTVINNLSNSFTVSHQPQDLQLIFLEALEKTNSAHAVYPMVSDALQERINEFILAEIDNMPSLPKCLKITTDPLPELPATYGQHSYGSDEWISARTRKRMQLGLRLIFTPTVTRSDNEITLHLGGFRHVMIPCIEDAEFFSVRIPDVKKDELVGLDQPWEDVMRALKHINDEQSLNKPEYGILLCGPPGTGKTSFAKAVAAELGLPFIYMSTSDLCCGHPAEGVKRVQKLFAAAHRTGAIIFLDEIDALGSRSTRSGYYDVVINALLTELDGFRSRRVLVIAATNRPEALDEALTRSGRLHTRIVLGTLKNDADRARLISIFCADSGISIDPQVLEFAVRCTYDHSPSDIKAIMACAVEEALTAERPLERTDIIKGLQKEYFGENTQQVDSAHELLRLTALHESGHALACSLYSIPWVQVTINSGGNALGYLERERNDDNCHTVEDIRNLICMALAGRAAEEILATPAEGASSDFKQAQALAGRIIDEHLDAAHNYSGMGPGSRKRAIEIEKILQMCYTRVKELLQRHRDVLAALTDALLAKRILLQEDVAELLHSLQRA